MEPGLVGDVSARQRFIVGWSALTVPVTFAAGAALHFAVVPPVAGPIDAGARALLAMRSVGLAILPLAVVIGHVMLYRLVSGAHNPLLGAEDERLRIHLRVLQNTLEQTVLFAAGAGACAATLPAGHLHLLVTAALVFLVGRALFWWGYFRPGNVLGRTPGVQVTAVAVYFLVITGAALTVRGLLP